MAKMLVSSDSWCCSCGEVPGCCSSAWYLCSIWWWYRSFLEMWSQKTSVLDVAETCWRTHSEIICGASQWFPNKIYSCDVNKCWHTPTSFFSLQYLNNLFSCFLSFTVILWVPSRCLTYLCRCWLLTELSEINFDVSHSCINKLSRVPGRCCSMSGEGFDRWRLWSMG